MDKSCLTKAAKAWQSEWVWNNAYKKKHCTPCNSYAKDKPTQKFSLYMRTNRNNELQLFYHCEDCIEYTSKDKYFLTEEDIKKMELLLKLTKKTNAKD